MKGKPKSQFGVLALAVLVCLTLNAVGCGGGGGGGDAAGTSPAGTTSLVGGTVFDPAVRDALVEFFRDRDFTDRMTPREGTVRTKADGSYTATFAGTLPTFVFIRTTGGVDTATSQSAPQLLGVSQNLGTGSLSGSVSANGLGALLVNELQGAGTPGLPAAATPEEAYARVRSIFPTLPGDPLIGFGQINATQGADFTGDARSISDAVIAAARASGGTTSGAIVDFCARLAKDDTTALNTLQTAAQTRSVTIANPVRFFAVSGLTVGGQSLAVPGALTGLGAAQFAAPANPVDIGGTARLPVITLSASNVSSGGFPVGTVFPGATLTLTIDGTASDQRRLVVTVDRARATVATDGSVAFAIDQGAVFRLSGTDSSGAAIAIIQAVNQGADAIATTNGSTFTFDTDVLVNQMRGRLGGAGFNSSHPAFLLTSAGTFDLTFTSTGLPFGLSPNASGFSTLQVNSVQIQGQHTF